MLCLTIKTLVNTSPAGRSVGVGHLSVMLDTILMYPLTSLILTKNFFKLKSWLHYALIAILLISFNSTSFSPLPLICSSAAAPRFLSFALSYLDVAFIVMFFSFFISFLLCFSVFFFVYVTSCVSILCFVPFQFSFAVLAVVCLGYWSAIACFIDFNCVCTFPIGFYK